MRGRKVEDPGLAGADGNDESREGITLQIGMPLAQVSRFPRERWTGTAAGDDIKKVGSPLLERAGQLDALGLFFRMTLSLTTEVRMIKGVGPQRAELLAQRGIYTLEELLTDLPLRFHDRTRFSNIRDIHPNATDTIRPRVMSAQALHPVRAR